MRISLSLVVLVILVSCTTTQYNFSRRQSCPPFYVRNFWSRRCLPGGPDNCSKSQYWDLRSGRCTRSPCPTLRGMYFDQGTRTCRHPPNCGRDNYYEGETGLCKKCPNGHFGNGLYCILSPSSNPAL